MSYHMAQAESVADFTTIIDVRSPSEFKEDHIYGAINCPVLDDVQRAEVGTLHRHDVFQARRLGAAYISQNMAELLQTTFAQYEKKWAPLVYCWRGGMRSGSAVHIMGQIGWSPYQLKGGYKSYRRQLLADLEVLPSRFNYVVVCGPTGSGKSRFLGALAAHGHQVLDLEALAKHRGSLLGLCPGDTQPSQRYFETCLHHALKGFNAQKPVYIEAESKRIGLVTLPPALFERMHESPCLEVLVPQAERIRFLAEDYHFYIENPLLLEEKIQRLAQYKSKKELDEWRDLIERGAFAEFTQNVLEKHYDPLYKRSMLQHYPQLREAQKVEFTSLDHSSVDQMAKYFVLEQRYG